MQSSTREQEANPHKVYFEVAELANSSSSSLNSSPTHHQISLHTKIWFNPTNKFLGFSERATTFGCSSREPAAG